MNDENIYWLFSSAAQSIATFVAFLLAGYTLVHAMMGSVQQRDDTLEEIHGALIRQYYQQIKSLAIITGAAVLSSLTMLYLNGFAWPYKAVLVVIAALLDIAAIVWGLTFVIRIIDPDKYKNAAKRLIEEDTQAVERDGKQEDAKDFFALFERLETALQNVVERAGLPLPADERSIRNPFFRQILALYQNRLIDRAFFNNLLKLDRYHNLAYYGRVRTIDQTVIDQARSALSRLQTLSR